MGSFYVPFFSSVQWCQTKRSSFSNIFHYIHIQATTVLKRSGLGCYIGHIFAGEFGYADITLLAPTRSSMVRLYGNIGAEYTCKLNGYYTRFVHLVQDDIISLIFVSLYVGVQQ